MNRKFDASVTITYRRSILPSCSMGPFKAAVATALAEKTTPSEVLCASVLVKYFV
jgi:hypothetical protein